jgi:hypothetical protein
MSVLELFCHVDDFCRCFEPKWHKQCLASGSKQRNRARELALSEIMTILILFHSSHYRTFKAFYTEQVCVDLQIAAALSTSRAVRRCSSVFQLSLHAPAMVGEEKELPLSNRPLPHPS